MSLTVPGNRPEAGKPAPEPFYRPPCMDDAEWQRYVDAAAEYREISGQSPKGPCMDCTRDFAESMRDEGRCDSEPGPRGNRKPPTPQRLLWREYSRARAARLATA